MPDWLQALIPHAAAAVAVYVGIRVDLARLHERVGYALKVAERANARIDSIIDNKG
ncbi:MAG TPA: hypothetical protein VGE36_14175 [Roseateles sp.]